MQSKILLQTKHSWGMGAPVGRLPKYPKTWGQSEVFFSFCWFALELRIMSSTFFNNWESPSLAFSMFSFLSVSSWLTVAFGSSLVKQWGQASYCSGGVTDRLVRRMGSWISLRHLGFWQTNAKDSSGNLIASQVFLLDSDWYKIYRLNEFKIWTLNLLKNHPFSVLLQFLSLFNILCPILWRHHYDFQKFLTLGYPYSRLTLNQWEMDRSISV